VNVACPSLTRREPGLQERKSDPIVVAQSPVADLSTFCGKLENVLNIEVQQGNSLGRETLAGLIGHIIAECRQDIPRYFKLAP
jgi:hypothetical protein